MASKAISLRVPTERLALIERAAATRGQNRTEFMIESACNAAAAALGERQLFELDDAAYAAFVEALNAPEKPNERLRSLLVRRAPWD
ncbi:MAG: DUF1778 domain-containing protein [Pseudomonadales bacterium]|nr:DUF1778 domain-containing protein [Pseudomonadales bacterium]